MSYSQLHKVSEVSERSIGDLCKVIAIKKSNEVGGGRERERAGEGGN